VRWLPMILLAAAAFPVAARAIDLEKLVMPGPVIEGHADIEGDCSRCHIPFRVDQEKGLCVNCHEDVARDIESGAGFHGRGAGISTSTCRSCHAEHLGRQADIVGLDRETFDHRITDFPLLGWHIGATCEACHEAKSRFRETKDACIDCHEADDAHAGTLGIQCGDCHFEKGWIETRFDHSATRFPLSGKHRDVSCNLCHPGDRYEKTAMDCQSCHGLDDVHLGRFGSNCASCHAQEGWKQVRFDHSRDTKFVLRGSHRLAVCNSCHETGASNRKPPMECLSCHRSDDEHRGRNGTNCERCHGEDDWKDTIFDHDVATQFPLRGAHGEARCNQCHMGVSEDAKVDGRCASCHMNDDVHREQQGTDCGDCHGELGWDRDVFFEHDLTRFPLLGLHAVIACEQCHANPRFKDAEIDCAGCHIVDDVHRENLGSTCERCHNPNGWNLWRFDHGKETAFELNGAHSGIDCHDCHGSAADRVATTGGCSGCHARDDRHFGAFGLDCERCHGDSSWSDLEKIR
jgi:hypothetical protein